VSRYQGDKKISSLPYTLSVITDERNRNSGHANLRLGTQVPITSTVLQGNGDNARMVPSVQYRDTGTNIDCNLVALEEGRFKVTLTVEDSSIDAGAGSANGGHPSFKSFRTSESLLMKDGQS